MSASLLAILLYVYWRRDSHRAFMRPLFYTSSPFHLIPKFLKTSARSSSAWVFCTASGNFRLLLSVGSHGLIFFGLELGLGAFWGASGQCNG
jgi:hypothetical protein